MGPGTIYSTCRDVETDVTDLANYTGNGGTIVIHLVDDPRDAPLDEAYLGELSGYEAAARDNCPAEEDRVG